MKFFFGRSSKWIYRFLLLCTVRIACIDGRKLSSWRGPTSFLLGNFPVERDRHGVAEALGMIFVFGGKPRTAGMFSTSIALRINVFLVWL